MPTVYAILGEDNTRKSSTIRALSGAGQHRPMDIQTRAGMISVYIQISALQESMIQPQAFVQLVAAGRYPNVLVASRIAPLRKRGQLFSSGVAYLAAFAAAGWAFHQIVLLGTTTPPAGLPRATLPPFPVPQAAIIPANQIAAALRATWSWL